MDRKPVFPRLLVVSPYFASHGGGVEIVAGHLAAGLAQQGFGVTWAASDGDEPPHDGLVQCIPMRSLNAIERSTGVPLPLWTPAALRRLFSAVRDADVVMVHESLYACSLSAAAMARRLRKPLLVVQHVGDVPYRNPVLRLLVRMGNAVAARFVHSRASQLVFISRSVQDYFGTRTAALRPAPVLIPNGVALDVFRPAGTPRNALRLQLGLATSRPVVLFVGRFVEKKGLRLLEQLARQRPGWDWIFVGSGPIDPAAWKLAHVRVVGRVSQRDLPGWYRAADLLVLPSVGEGFPLVVQEAMACGLPVAVSDEVAAALPGVAAHVHSAPVRSDAAADTPVWLRLLDQAVGGVSEARRSAVAGFAQEHWSWERCVSEYAGILSRLLNAGVSRP